MTVLERALADYIQNYNDSQVNFDLGWQYELAGQTGSAIGFYLRSAEKTDNTLKQYEVLIRCAICLDKQKDRNDSVKVLLQKAICLIPTRPEAYFLVSRLCEQTKSWQDSYTYASLGLVFADFDVAPLSTKVDYPGKFGLIFEKGVSAWWIGHCEESQEIMADLQANYTLDTPTELAVIKNIETIGYPLNIRNYCKNIRHKFEGVDTIVNNYSEAYQDMFVLTATNGKRNGVYLEIGSADAFKHNNTALLETKFAWTGASIDIRRELVEEFNEVRNNLVFCLDATKIDYSKFIKKFHKTTDIDYLQVDCDPPVRSLEILQSMPFDEYRFAVITFEHDCYADPTVRDVSREFLISKGYRLIASDIAYNATNSYEDWWVHPDLVDLEIQEKLLDLTPGAKYAKDYLFPA
jgi:tetratricopeptide (TPR) repeat protein